MKKFGITAILVAFVLAISGCNTVKGIGKDVSAAGEGINKGATAVSNKL